MPKDYIDPPLSELATDRNLSDFISFTNSSGNILNITYEGTLVYQLLSINIDQYQNLIASNVVADKGIYGLGGRLSDSLKVNSGIYTLWNRDTSNPYQEENIETGKLPASNTESSHPFYMA